LATADFGFVIIPPTSLPFPPTSSNIPKQVIPIDVPVSASAEEKRFNDGAVDPAGRFLAGTMGLEHEDVVGRMYSLREDSKGVYSAPLVLDKITCTNGMGWSPDGKTL
jgi:sugar lactone lactonase YvrE